MTMDAGVLAGADCIDAPVFTFENMGFRRQHNPDRIVPAFVPGDVPGYRAVRLAVKSGSYQAPLCNPADVENDRCELWGRQMPFPTEAWFGFAIQIPDDFPAMPQRCVVAQIKCPFHLSIDPSPVFSLRIDQRRWLATIEHLYEESDFEAKRFLSKAGVPGTCPQNGVPALQHAKFPPDPASATQIRAILATDGRELPPDLRADRNFSWCTTGVRVTTSGLLPLVSSRWVDFIVHFDPAGGLVELFCDNLPVASARGVLGKAASEQSNQYLKVGIYRDQVPNNPVADPNQWSFADELAIHAGHLRSGHSLAEVTRALPETLVA